MRKLLAAFASNVVFANIMILLMFLVGAFSVSMMRREMFPEMSLDRISISVPYPGADPEEVEEGILRKIEDALQGESGIKELITMGSENVGTAVVTVDEQAKTRDVLDRVRAKINAISTFPEDAENPVISEMLLEDAVMVLSVSGEMPEARMKEWAERVKEDLLQEEAITIVEIFGSRDYEIAIEVSEPKLQEFNLSIQQVMQSIRNHNLNVPAGLIRSDTEEIRLRTMGRKYTGLEIANIPVITRMDGTVVRLGDVATVKDGFAQDAMRPGVDGLPALFIYVNKTSDQDALDISKATLDFIDKTKKTLPDGMNLELIFDSTDMLRARINLLVKNGIIGLSLVFVLLWLFLDFRLSFWAGMGMPISIAGALVILWAIGGSLNMISLFGLIMVLGIIVDDAIVVGESIYHHQQKPGADPYLAAVEGVSEVGMPVLGAVSTTIIAFLPLMFVGGIMGKFISILPVVVIACLVVSLYECLLLLPAHLGEKLPALQKKNPSRFIRFTNTLHRHTGRRLERFASGPYQRFLNKALDWRYLALGLSLSILIITGGAIQGGRLAFQMFPSFDSFMLTAFVEFPSGTPIDVTDNALTRIEKAAEKLNTEIKTKSGNPAIQKITRLAGQNLNDPYASTRGQNVGSVQLILVENADRNMSSKKIKALWEEYIGRIPGAEALTMEELNAGPPGKPVDVRLMGSNLTVLRKAAAELKGILEQYPGTSQIQSDLRPGKNELRFRLKPEALNMGVSVADLGRQLNQAYYGGEALRIQRGRDEIKIMVRNTEEERSQLSDLERLRIRTPDGREVPLFAVADMEASPGYAKITRVDGLRAVSVNCDINTEVANAGKIATDLETNHFPALQQAYPGVYLEFQGEKKDSEESVGSLKVGFPIALVGIFVIIATIFRSYLQPLIIMLTVPFGIIGAVIGHQLKGIELSLMSLFGIVALAGVVVNDAIVLIEAYNTNISKGMDIREALLEAGNRRFRAVFLTTLSTVGGLTPMILETDLQAQFLIPMALSIAAGVAFATLLTLLLIPSLILILNDLRCGFHYLFKGTIPESRAALEPARHRNRHNPTS
jgi:multidrug efflux pump subunit AcrB